MKRSLGSENKELSREFASKYEFIFKVIKKKKNQSMEGIQLRRQLVENQREKNKRTECYLIAL